MVFHLCDLMVSTVLGLTLALYAHAATTELPPFATLTAKPSTIDVNLTETLEMDCRLQTRNNVKNIISIVILRQGSSNKNELVASVTSFDPAKIAKDNGSLVAYGTVDIPTNHLRLVWEHPNHNQAGVYSCEINAIDSNARLHSLMTTFTISGQVPSVEVLIHHIRDLEKRADIMEERMALMSRRMATIENAPRNAPLP